MKKLILLILLFAAALPAAATSYVRVALKLAVDNMTISCPAGLAVELPDGKQVYSGHEVRVQWQGNLTLLNGKTTRAPELLVRPKTEFQLDNRAYRGLLEIRTSSNGLEAINVVDIEKYLYSVVGSEMPSKWPLEALKAQAVVARTYAMKKIEERTKFQFDVLSTFADQAYDGVAEETQTTRRAVDATRGQVVTFKGKLAMAYYHSDCGGRTENGSAVFKGDFPYLKSVACPFGQKSPYRHWKKTFTLSEVSKQLGKKVYNLHFTYSPQTQRVENVALLVHGGQISIAGYQFRRLLGLREIRSTHFDVHSIRATILVPRLSWISVKTLTEKASTEVARKSFSDQVANLSGPEIYVIDQSGALSFVHISQQNPLVVISGDGMISVVYKRLSALFLKTELAFKKIFYPKLAARVKKLSWVPAKVPAAFTFTGSGWGHGVGMCQWGARGMALIGKKYTEILHYYYTGISLEKI